MSKKAGAKPVAKPGKPMFGKKEEKAEAKSGKC